ncbi:HAD family hydrolase [Micromonospora zamorensis]|uniref:HAD family hydrolase n=3 Tax=Micromonospora TaxID=1873 RepID=A0A3N9WUI0_9ACTN|nr:MULTISPECIES: HAD family phosphatase [Micromonospora]RQW99276.1 HAD family hydrolase [Micromonospora inaquosa]RQX04474.1 HAD family hydrolase [Micromonospora arida]WSK48408.1 HAD family phosphatase [Micromonospora zamorensis]
MTARTAVPDGKTYEALIFDWDGTLVDSRDVCFGALARAMGDAGVKLDPDWYWPRQAIASPDMLIVWEQEFGPLPEPIDEIIGRCRFYVQAAAPDLKVVEEIARVARAARRRGQRLGIGSNASTNTVWAGLEATGLDALFDVVVTWSDVPQGRGKPEPDIFLLVAQRLGADPARCLVYEDAEVGVTAALSAGMTAYNVQTGVLHRPVGSPISAAPVHRPAFAAPSLAD